MTRIYECETEIGKCAYKPEDMRELKYAEPDYSLVFASTLASLNGRQGMLRIEQQCYLRHGGERPDQPWIKPEITHEPILGSKEEMVELAKSLHEQFLERVRKKFPQEFLV